MGGKRIRAGGRFVHWLFCNGEDAKNSCSLDAQTGSGIGTLSHLLRDNAELLSYFGFEPPIPSTLAASRVFAAIE